MATLTTCLAMSSALCSSNWMCVAPVILTLGDVVMNLVWNFLLNSDSDCMMHWTSTIIASTAPVMTASSWFRSLPALGMPWRIMVSFDVQQTPTRLMPLAPLDSAYLMSSGSVEAR